MEFPYSSPRCHQHDQLLPSELPRMFSRRTDLHTVHRTSESDVAPGVHTPQEAEVDLIGGCRCNSRWNTQHTFQHSAEASKGETLIDYRNKHPPSHTNSCCQTLYHGADVSREARSGERLCCMHCSLPPKHCLHADCKLGHRHDQTYASIFPGAFPPLQIEKVKNIEQTNESTSKGSNHCAERALVNQVTVYSWYLLRPGGSCSSEVAIGGFFSAGEVDNERVETAPIVKRLGKRKLLAKDGVEVRLMGLIDDCTTFSNGFPLQIVHSFLSGFPYVWQLLIGNIFLRNSTGDIVYQVSGSCDLSGSERDVNQEQNINQLQTSAGEEEAPVPSQLAKIMIPLETITESCVASDLAKDNAWGILQKGKDMGKDVVPTLEKMSEVEARNVCKEQVSQVNIASECTGSRATPLLEMETENRRNAMTDKIQVLVQCGQRRCSVGTLNGAVDELNDQSIIAGDCVTRQERDSEPKGTMLDMVSNRVDDFGASLRKSMDGDMAMRNLMVPSHVTRSKSREHDNMNVASGSRKEQASACNLSAMNASNGGEGEANSLKAGLRSALIASATNVELPINDQTVKRSTKKQRARSRNIKKQPAKPSIETLDGAADQLNEQFIVTGSEDGITVQQRDSEPKSILPDVSNLINNVGESLGRFVEEDMATQKLLVASRATRSRCREEDNLTCRGAKSFARDGYQKTFHATPNGDDIIAHSNDSSLEQRDVENSPAGMEVEHIHEDDTSLGASIKGHLRKAVTRADFIRSEEKAAKSLKMVSDSCKERAGTGDIAAMNACNNAVGDVISLKTGVGSVVITSGTDVEIPIDDEKLKRSSVKRKAGLTKLESQPNKPLVASQSGAYGLPKVQGFTNTNKLREEELKIRLNDVGNRSTHIEGGGDLSMNNTGRKKAKILPPPLPRPRVSVSKRLVSTAFGLKTSRSGRLLVPPLAHWRSQTVAYDMDGGIIAILNGSEDTLKFDTGHFDFKPPSQAGARKLQKRLCDAASELCTKKK